MKNLEIQKYGLEELNHREMLKTEGGSFWGVLGICAAIIGAVVGWELVATAGVVAFVWDAAVEGKAD